MAFILGDVYIGNFPETQAFGADYQTYHARYGLSGHNGIDIGCPTMTPVLSAADGWVSEKGFDAGGYGNYIKIVHNGYLTLYGHLNDIAVNLKDQVVSGQLVGHSNNTGMSTGPHLHFGVAPCDGNGIKTEANNGFSGYIDPNGSLCQWEIKNLTAPVVPQHDSKPPVQVPFEIYPIIIAQGTNYITLATYLQNHGVNDFLSVKGLPLIDLKNNPGDPTAGQRITEYMDELFTELSTLKEQQPPAPAAPVVTDAQKQSFLSGVWQSVSSFIFTPKQS